MSQDLGWKPTLLFGLNCLGNVLIVSEVILLGLSAYCCGEKSLGKLC